MSKYIAIYEAIATNDFVDKDDPRRAAIISEMRGVARAKTVDDARVFMKNYFGDIDAETKAIIKIRELARSK